MDSIDEINQQLDDVLLDDLVDAQEQLGEEDNTRNLTPSQAVYDDQRDQIVETEIARLGEELGVDESTRATAKTLFDQFAAEYDLQGNALEVIAAACLYTACKVESIGLNPDDFAAVPETAFTRVVLLRRVKSISSTLGLDPRAFFDPHAYIDRYCEELGLSTEITDRAHEVIDIADEIGAPGGKSPTGRAAAAIYNAVLEHNRVVTQSDIARVADVTEVTIRNRYQEQRELLEGGTVYQSADDADTNTTGGERDVPDVNKENSATSADSTEFESNAGAVKSIQDLDQYVDGEVVDNIKTSLMQLDEADEQLVTQTQDVCRRIAEGGVEAWFGTDDVTLALAIIRVASEEIDSPISYPTLRHTLEDGEDKVYRVSTAIANNL